ncbi:hypothetical protein FPSE_02556 [Fusarium pseudograminearum CS3096]|uniref:Methyltransferase domain-containing protein n=1 Tax=Fusarium pseudograminearum (strain CS3096) TaxID=1028729 RepID=K3UX93_FUSPC|nr:hypothetical protein FPSE_02556 [Fusarium pseudograminearum CS3096]EKJ77281.1 hypothetical protein FPSE_02556 [Fusarium pseudograminearum CS3096]
MPAGPSRLPHWTLVFVPMINGKDGTPMISGPKVNSENDGSRDEISRLEVMHGVLSGLFDRRLIFPPIRSPRRVLDCGCGTGDWAMEVATQYPDSEVLGIDISPHMIPENPPDNMELQVDDLNGRFTFKPNHFDLVHSQMLAGGIHANRWRSYLRDIFRVLKPGGWCQMVEIYFNAQSDNGTLTPGRPCFIAVVKTISGKSRTTPRPAGTIANGELDEKCGLYRSRIETHDITDVWLVEQYDGMMFYSCFEADRRAVPRDYEIGVSNRDNVSQLLSSLALYPFTQMLGMSFTDFQLLVAQARSEASNPAFKAYFPL